ncbi:hypothetical protein [Anaerotignum sp.]|uniref:hypothetical protein n=1 Tax=Anaerotignum sp. TaxID=2039241 RepID=UPI00289C7D20|nr:hypothetical protein [Anaerotignum sp.]
MKFNQRKLWVILLLINITVFGFNYLLSSKIQNEGLEIARKFDATPTPYVPETEAKEIKPANWYSVYLPSTLPDFYELGGFTITDTYISCSFARPVDYKKETSLDNSYPYLNFMQWNSSKEFIPWGKSIAPPILRTGKFQTYGSSVVESEEQLELQMNASVQLETYNGKEYSFTTETKNGYPLLLWHDAQYTFALTVEPGTGSKAHLEITLDDMLKIADQVKEYS